MLLDQLPLINFQIGILLSADASMAREDLAKE